MIITIFMKGAPRSEQFDDIYFSAHDGVEETKHVFLVGNNLPNAWTGKDHFTIAETGFGTGLNFFSAWKLFEESAEESQSLDFISFEKYPLSKDDIKNALEPWAEYFDGRIDTFLKQYPIRVAGFHRIKITSQITLTLIFDDMNDAIEQLNVGVDCWFLDGFSPAKNPDMWSDILFKNMARLSKEGATFATFTAAGLVRNGLKDVGFTVRKIEGFKYKTDMSVGCFDKAGDAPVKPKKMPQKIAIIGGGLAGTACAYVLKQYGFTPVIYEKSDYLAAGASGNNLGFYNPRFSKLRDEFSAFYAPAYAQFITMAQSAGAGIEYDPCGALHLMNDEDKNIRLKSMADNWAWHKDHVGVVSQRQASDIAGVALNHDALYLPDSGSVCPKKLCEYYARDIKVHLNHDVKDLKSLDADAVIICTASDVKNFDCLTWLSVETVKGQVTTIETPQSVKDIQCNIHYGGYVSNNKNGELVTGATFTKWVDDWAVSDEDHQRNLSNLLQNIPVLSTNEIKIKSGWVGFRTATNDRFPVIGAVPNVKNIYVSTAFGSHGLLGSLTGAHHLADLMRGVSCALPDKTAYVLSPQRFIDRAAKKGKVLV